MKLCFVFLMLCVICRLRVVDVELLVFVVLISYFLVDCGMGLGFWDISVSLKKLQGVKVCH